MKSEGREYMVKDGGELIEAVEDETVLPNINCKHQHPHTENIVCLKDTNNN